MLYFAEEAEYMKPTLVEFELVRATCQTARNLGMAILFALLFLYAAREVRAEGAQQTLPGEFLVVDSAGKLIGPIVGTMQSNNVTIVVIPFQGKWLPVSLTRSAFLQGSLLYTSTDCTGQPFGDASASPFLAADVQGASSTLYYENGPSQTITVQSFLGGGGNCGVTGCISPCTTTPPSTGDYVPMAAGPNLNIFTSPFSVKRAKTQ
jgi:hypothetical protein